jgi:hypothetical protein
MLIIINLHIDILRAYPKGPLAVMLNPEKRVQGRLVSARASPVLATLRADQPAFHVPDK